MNATALKIVEQFERGDIDPDAFDHGEHVRVAWHFVEALGAETGTERFVAALKALTHALGMPMKYHETITRFFLGTIVERRQNGETWDAFAAANADLVQRGGVLLARAYTPEILASDCARATYVRPIPEKEAC